MIAIGFLASLRSASHRWDAERDNRKVEIALDYNELRTLAAADGDLLPNGQQRAFTDVLRLFRSAGATSVAVEEDTIGGLEQSRRLTIVPGADRGATLLRPLNAISSQRLLNALTHKTHYQVEVVTRRDEPVPVRTRRKHGKPVAKPVDTAAPATIDILVHEPINVVRAVGIGLDPSVTTVIVGSGLSVVGRIGNYPGADSAGIQWAFDELKKAGASTLIFTGEEVLGYSGPVPPGATDPNKEVVPDALKSDHLNYGTVEFGKQKGDVELQRLAADNTVRVHTILGTEMVTADIPSNVQRFRLAARERNIRVLFVRLFLSEPRPVATNVEYVREIRHELEHARLTALAAGVAHGYIALRTSVVVRVLIGFGVAAAWLLLLDSVCRFLNGEAGRGGYVLGVVPAICLVALCIPSSLMGAKIVALAAGCIYPSLGLLYKDRLEPANGQSANSIALARFATTIGITLLGIAAIVGLLADRLFLLKTDMFLGVKLVAIAPALVVAFVYGLNLRASAARPWRVAVGDAAAAIKRVATEPINLSQVMIALVVLAAFAIIVMRSGNDPGVGVSPLELKLRGVLDLLLPARPRFKDLVGHPALLIAFLFAARGYYKWALPFLVVGAIGLSSMLDAFCHLHTPIQISLTRDGLALGLGLVFYFVIYLLVLRPLLRRVRPAAARP